MSSQLITFSYPEDNERFYNLLKQLRPHLTFDNFKEIYLEANKATNYQLIGLEIDSELQALVGFRVLHDFIHGKHLYIDDLVSSELHQSKGHGAFLLKHMEAVAAELGCSNLRLCTGIENERGKQFYEKNLWNLRAVVFKKKAESIGINLLAADEDF